MVLIGYLGGDFLLHFLKERPLMTQKTDLPES